MVYGQTTFKAEENNKQNLKSNILKGKIHFLKNVAFSHEGKDIVRELL